MKQLGLFVFTAGLGLSLLFNVGCASTRTDTKTDTRSGNSAKAASTAPAQAPAAKPSPDAPVMATPTAEDKKLVETYDELMLALDDSIAREIFNHFRGNKFLKKCHDAMHQGEPLDAGALRHARRYFKTQIAAAKKSYAWPKPIDYTIARSNGRIVIDGKMDDADWSAATPIALKYDFNNPVPVPSNATARMLWDDQYLYAVFVVPDADIQVPDVPNDTPTICTFDCAELFIMPNPAWDLYWEINASPNGPVYDALNFWRRDGWMSQMRIDLNIKNLTIKTSTLDPKYGGPGYVTEMAVPWNQMPMPAGQAPKAGHQLKGLMGIAQLNIVEGKRRLQYLSHSPMLANFHNVRTMPTLTLGQ